LVADVDAAFLDVVALVAESLALTALAAASLAFVVAITVWAVTSLTVASVLESPAPPFPLYIAIVAPTKTKEKERGLRRIPSLLLA
jgi:hypothetical protein